MSRLFFIAYIFFSLSLIVYLINDENYKFINSNRATSAAAYQTGQAGYAVTPAATAATYTQRPAAAAATGYETYQAAAAAAATGTTYAGKYLQ